jgi:hypothetical protein
MVSDVPTVERRRNTKFGLRLPIETIRIDGEGTSMRGVTENISSPHLPPAATEQPLATGQSIPALLMISFVTRSAVAGASRMPLR